MKSFKKTIIIVVSLSIIVFTTIYFHEFTLEYVLKPVSLAVWILLRSTILLFNQKIIWWSVIILFTVVLLLKIITFKKTIYNEKIETLNLYTDKYTNFRRHFLDNAYTSNNRNRLKPDLLKYLLLLFAARKRIAPDYRLSDSLKNKEIELPPEIYSFLYSEIKLNESLLSFKKIYRKLSGRESREYYQKLNDYLTYIENFLESDNE